MKAKTSVTVVLVGKFDTDSFSPGGFEEAIGLEAGALHADAVLMRVPGQALQMRLPWGEATVVAERFQVSIIDPPFVRACDFAVKAVSELAPHSIITAFGINVQHRVTFASASRRDRLGIQILPPGAWGSWGKEILEGIVVSGGSSHGGMVSAKLREELDRGDWRGWLDVEIAPHLAVGNALEVIFTSNFHQQPVPTGDASAVVTAKLLDRLATCFDFEIDRAMNIFSDLVESSDA